MSHTPRMNGLSITNLSVALGGVRVLDRVSLEIPAGHLTVLLGVSGAGKSTLLNAIAGLVAIETGSIRRGDQAIEHLPPGKRSMAMVFQDYAPYPHLNARQNIALPLKGKGLSHAQIEQGVLESAQRLDLVDLLDRRPIEMSGGQLQRLAFARALARQTDVLLLDEPLAGVDAMLRDRMRWELRQLQARLGITMVYVTHDQTDAMLLGDQVAVLEQGQILQVGKPEDIYHDPEHRMAALLLGNPTINLFDDAENPACEIGIRPEHLSIGTGHEHDWAMQGRIDSVHFLGDRRLVWIANEHRRISMLIPPQTALSARESISVFAPARWVMRFDASTGQRIRND